MKFLKLLSLILLSSFVFTSCGKKSKLGKIIPKEAVIVVDLNTKSLLSKLSWDEIKKTNWYNHVMTDSSVPATAKVFIGDPGKTGIDLSTDIVFFLLNPDSTGQAVVQGNLKDSKAFADFIRNMHPNVTASKEGELNIFKTNDAVIGWNDDRFMLVSNTEHHAFNMGDTGTNTINTIPMPAPASENLVKVCKDLFSLSSDNSLYSNERFADLADEDGDVRFWVNSGEMVKRNMKNMPGMFGMVKLDKLFDDNVSASTIRFEDGKITGKSKQYFGKELSDILKKGEGNINVDMIKKLPVQNVAAVMAFHFTPANLLEIIKLTGLDGFINLMLTQQGISLDDVVKATKGDIVFSVSDITLKTDTGNIKDLTKKDTGKYNDHRSGDAAFTFAIAVGDKDAFNKVTNVAKNMGKEVGPKNLFSKSDDKYFVLSNKQDAAEKYFSSTPSAPAFLDKIKDHPMGGYVDVQMILKGLQPALTEDSSDNFYYSRNITMWNNVFFTGGEYKDGGLVSSGEVNLVDKSTNSLKQLNQYIDDIFKVAMEERKKRMDKGATDSISVKIDSTVNTKHKPAVK